MTKQLRWVYDLETYPNIFSMTVIREDGKFPKIYEVSDRKNDTQGIIKCFRYMRDNEIQMVGFNNLGFDYPILHQMMQELIHHKRRHGTLDNFEFDYNDLYEYAQEIIQSYRNNDRFGKTVRESDIIIPQIDLFKIHHFDNKAKSTSLKMLEFNMRSESIEDLPFPVGMELDDSQKDILLSYNLHDVEETLRFYGHTKPAIEFREQLSEKLGVNTLNFNDTKIGKEYFIKELEKQIPGICYRWEGRSRKINQTVRDEIIIADVLFNYYDFKRPEFIAVLDWFGRQRIKETKGVFSDLEEHELYDVAKYANLTEKRQKFMHKPSQEQIDEFKQKRPLGWIQEETLKQKYKGEFKKSYWKHWRVAENLNVVIDGFQFDFGTGGIHGSLESTLVVADDEYEIVDADVSSMYPNIGISNRVYPLHLSEAFCVIYQDVYNQRKSFKKGTPENAVMKLALNGVYGDSNNKYSPFYDPAYTMAITINGQLSLCLLAEKLMTIPSVRIIQVNTDGVTVRIARKDRKEYDRICVEWQKQVKLELEFAEYSKMYIRDVNNYLAIYTNGKVKRKGAYEYENLGWHQNHGGLIIPMAAEAYMVHGKDILEFVKNHKDDFDFMLRTKVDRSSKLVSIAEDGTETQLQNICRYYPVMQGGGQLIKIMKPLAGKTEDRRLSIDAGWNMQECNHMKNFNRDNLRYDYYVEQAMKLVNMKDLTDDSCISEGSESDVE